METALGVSIIIIFALVVALLVITDQRDNMRDTINKLTDNHFSSQIKPYEHVLYYMAMFKKLDQQLTDSKVVISNLWGRYRGGMPLAFTTLEMYIAFLKKQNLIFDTYGEEIPYHSVNELKTNAKDLKSKYKDAIRDL